MMRFQFQKYWHDLLMPVLRQDRPPTVPQAIVLQDQQVLLVKRDNPRFGNCRVVVCSPARLRKRPWFAKSRKRRGCTLRLLSYSGWYERTGFRAHLSPVYVCRPQSGPPQAQDTDTVQVRYFSLHQLPRGLCPGIAAFSSTIS